MFAQQQRIWRDPLTKPEGEERLLESISIKQPVRRNLEKQHLNNSKQSANPQQGSHCWCFKMPIHLLRGTSDTPKHLPTSQKCRFGSGFASRQHLCQFWCLPSLYANVPFLFPKTNGSCAPFSKTIYTLFLSSITLTLRNTVKPNEKPSSHYIRASLMVVYGKGGCGWLDSWTSLDSLSPSDEVFTENPKAISNPLKACPTCVQP